MARIRQDDITTLREKDLIPVVKIGISSIIGTREEQQDTVFELYKEPYYIAAVCDGMGGLCGGEVASRTAVEFLVQDFQSLGAEEDPTVFLKREAVKLDEAVCQLTGEDGEPLEAGTTIVAAMIRSGKFYWMSVGDSRIFYITRNRIFSITREHNYRLTLDILKKRGEISEEKYRIESERGEALISYLGMGNISLIDAGEEPVEMEKGDRVLLCSDGLYKTIEPEQILRITRRYRNVQEAAEALTGYVEAAGRKQQDNTSVILIQYA